MDLAKQAWYKMAVVYRLSATGFSTERPWVGASQNQSEINVSAQEKDPNSVLNFYKKLIALRKEEPFASGEYIPLPIEDKAVFRFKCKSVDKEATISVNFDTCETNIKF